MHGPPDFLPCCRPARNHFCVQLHYHARYAHLSVHIWASPRPSFPAGLLVIDVLVQLHYMRDMVFRAVTGTMVSGLATIPLGTTGTVGLDCE